MNGIKYTTYKVMKWISFYAIIDWVCLEIPKLCVVGVMPFSLCRVAQHLCLQSVSIYMYCSTCYVFGCAIMIFFVHYVCLFLVLGTEVRVPSLVKRASAEVIDCLILLLVKFFISYLLIHYGGFKWVSVIYGTLTIEQFYHYRTFLSLEILPSNINFFTKVHIKSLDWFW